MQMRQEEGLWPGPGRVVERWRLDAAASDTSRPYDRKTVTIYLVRWYFAVVKSRFKIRYFR